MKHPNTLMIQGTTSDAGKSVLVAAVCRILMRQGLRVAPFKPQNMALNSAVTAGGGEIGRAQAVQAMACGIEPHVDMNPVLLKPNSDTGAQVIVLGKAVGNMQAWGYHHKKPSLLPTVLEAHARLSAHYDVVIVEGAGSPAEINLRQGDIANMGFAEAADCPVIIVADIDRGGVFAHLYGTYECLSATEKARIKGFVINKFRGDESLLQSANEWLTHKTGVPVLAVIPYIPHLYIEAEDAIDVQQNTSAVNSLRVTVIVYPRISNHTDFDALRLNPHVQLTYARSPSDAPYADLIILPGSKNVQSDLAWLISNGWHETIAKHLRYGGKLLGICGGYQMLGKTLGDPDGIEGPAGQCAEGLGYLNLHTQLMPQKILRNVEGTDLAFNCPIKGYEIHAGQSHGPALERPLFKLRTTTMTVNETYLEGASSDDDLIKGTYLHGVLDNAEYLHQLLLWAGATGAEAFDYEAHKLAQLDYLADEVEKAWPANPIKQLLAL